MVQTCTARSPRSPIPHTAWKGRHANVRDPQVRGETRRPVRAYVQLLRTQKGRASVDLRDFESIPIYFSEEEMEELQAAIDERRRRLACEEEHPPEPPEQSDYSRTS
jgi:hypothetical protein